MNVDPNVTWSRLSIKTDEGFRSYILYGCNNPLYPNVPSLRSFKDSAYNFQKPLFYCLCILAVYICVRIYFIISYNQ